MDVNLYVYDLSKVSITLVTASLIKITNISRVSHEW